jgi:hypothetical protein
MLNPSQVFGCNGSGSSSSVLSMVLTIKSSTQMVITSGTQIKSPVIRYLFTLDSRL